MALTATECDIMCVWGMGIIMHWDQFFYLVV